MIMSKKVNVYPVIPIFTVYPPIVQNQLNIELPIGKIEKCLIARAKVEEILEDGTTIRLNLNNYNKELKNIFHNEERVIKEEPQPVKVEVKEEVVEEEPQPVKVEVKEEVVEEVKSEEEPQPVKVEVKEEEKVEENEVKNNKPQENRKNNKRR